MIFHKKHEITQNRVRDTITFREGDERLTLHVDGDAMRMVVGLTNAQKVLQEITAESSEDQIINSARAFASAIFGDTQAEKLMEFYRWDATCTIQACGKYFKDYLMKKVTAAQTKALKEKRRK